MLGKLKLRKRRAQLESTLHEDICQPDGFIEWLSGARSVRELYQSCREPGWLVYAGYWEGVSQDACLDGLMRAAKIASQRIERCPVPTSLLESLPTKDWPQVMEVIVDLERRHELTAALVDSLPSQLNFTLGACDAERHLLRDEVLAEVYELKPHLAGPYRSGADGSNPERDALLATGFVLVGEALFHRSEGLREALTVRAAAATSLFALVEPELKSDLLTIVRDAYGWKSPA